MDKNDKPLEIPYIVHESDMARMERINKILCIALTVSVVGNFVFAVLFRMAMH